MRILHMLCSDSFSGAENVACQIIHLFDADERIQSIYCSPDGKIRDALKARSVTFFPLRNASYSEFRRAIQEIHPDIIHAHDMKASFLAALAGPNIKIISHIHNNSYSSRNLSFKVLLYQSQFKRYSHIFWVSQAALDGYYFKNKISPKSSVLRNLIDMNEIQQKAEESPEKDAYDIVYLGRLTYPKNPERLIDVIEKTVHSNPDLQAAIIGQGDLMDSIEDRIRQKKLDQNVTLLGFKENPYGILEHAKLMLMTSRWEGLPMCTLEAMTLGVPIVSTPTDGLKEVIQNQVNGFLAETDEDLAKACQTILKNPELRLQMSDRAKKRAAEIMCADDYRKAVFDEYTHTTE